MKKGLVKFKLLATAVLVILIMAGGLPLWRHRHYQVEIILGPGVTEVKN